MMKRSAENFLSAETTADALHHRYQKRERKKLQAAE